jgi:hypothetical protein
VNKKPTTLIVSWSIFPHQSAMSVLVHNLAKAMDGRVVVFGEISNDDDSWDNVPYPIYQVDPFPFKFVKGREYFKWLKFRYALIKLTEVIKSHNCTAILCPFPDEFYMELSRVASKKMKISFYPWFHNTYLENRTGIKKTAAKILQPLFFKYASRIFSISNGLTSYYNNQYPNYKFYTLLHGFNIPETPYTKFEINLSQKIRFAYTGSFNESCRDAAVRLARVLTRVPKFELHVFGKRSAAMFESYGIPKDQFVSYGFLPEEEFQTKLKECHIMLLPHGFEGVRSRVEYETIFPTRTIPLLYSNRPILIHSPLWASITHFFKEHKCGHISSSVDEKQLLADIQDLINNNELQQDLIKKALKTAQLFDVKKIANEVLLLSDN